jgi:hypothetical protein
LHTTMFKFHSKQYKQVALPNAIPRQMFRSTV